MMTSRFRLAFAGAILLLPVGLSAQATPLDAAMEARIAAMESKVIAWRRDIHQHPELGNREARTAELIATHLRSLGIEVQTGVAYTGVVGVLRGGRPGPVVLLRADMDALPVTERVDLPFASKVKTLYNGVEVGVMHACGHDTHVAILMAVAEVMAAMQAELPGTIKFVFQPAEEGPPEGEEGGAALMVKEGVMTNPTVDVAFGLHIRSTAEINTLSLRPGGLLASADDFRITVRGRQTHGAYPWDGADPIVAAAQIVSALQTIVSRQINLTQNPAVVTVGKIQGGARSNIIPEQVELLGTLRALTTEDRAKIHEGVRRTATRVAEAMGVTAEVQIPVTTAYPVTFNNVALTQRMMPLLERVAGAGKVRVIPAVMGAEDFSFYAQAVPGLFLFLGGRSPEVAEKDAPPHHTPEFQIDERGLMLGVRTLAALTLDYMRAPR